MHENGTVNRNLGLNDICKGKHVTIMNRETSLRTDLNGKLIKWPALNPGMRSTLSLMIPYDWEIFKAFIDNHDIQPQWIPSPLSGENHYNKTTGLWTGSAGMMQRGEVDVSSAPVLDKFDSVEVGKSFHFTPPIMVTKFHWYSRLPQELSGTWNLIYLFPKE